MPRLIHLNGAPGSGKSTVASTVVADWPLMLVVEIDDLRTRIGGWRTHDETQLIARDLAVAMIETHLAAGHDVIVPQYLGRPEFIQRLADVATANGATFHEVVLEIDAETAADRVRSRGTALRASGGSHPADDVPDGAALGLVTDAIACLACLDVAGAPPTRVSADESTDRIAAAVRRAIT